MKIGTGGYFDAASIRRHVDPYPNLMPRGYNNGLLLPLHPFPRSSGCSAACSRRQITGSVSSQNKRNADKPVFANYNFCTDSPRPELNPTKHIDHYSITRQCSLRAMLNPSANIQNVSESDPPSLLPYMPKPRRSHAENQKDSQPAPNQTRTLLTLSASPCSSHSPDWDSSYFAHPPPIHHLSV